MTREGVEELLNAIIAQACKDYVNAGQKLLNPNLSIERKNYYKDVKQSACNFILNGWAMDFVEVDSEYIIKELEVIINEKRYIKSFKTLGLRNNSEESES